LADRSNLLKRKVLPRLDRLKLVDAIFVKHAEVEPPVARAVIDLHEHRIVALLDVDLKGIRHHVGGAAGRPDSVHQLSVQPYLGGIIGAKQHLETLVLVRPDDPVGVGDFVVGLGVKRLQVHHLHGARLYDEHFLTRGHLGGLGEGGLRFPSKRGEEVIVKPLSSDAFSGRSGQRLIRKGAENHPLLRR